MSQRHLRLEQHLAMCELLSERAKDPQRSSFEQMRLAVQSQLLCRLYQALMRGCVPIERQLLRQE